MEEATERAAVVPLIGRATNSTAADIDPRLLKAIKSSVRSSDSELRCAAQTLLSLMKRDHSQTAQVGYDYLKNTLRFQFPNLQANAARIQLERKEREMRTKEILLKKFESLKTSISSIKVEIQSTVDEIGGCLDILDTEYEDLPFATVDGEEIEEFRNSELWQIRHDSLREGGKFQENNENEIVFDALRELYKVLVTKHLAGIQEWLSVLIRVDVADSRFRDSTLKDFIDIRNLIRLTKDKCEESVCALPKVANTEEEDIWEDGTLQTFEKGHSVPNRSEGNDCPVALTADDANGIECHDEASNQSIMHSH